MATSPRYPVTGVIAQHLQDQQTGKRNDNVSVYSCPECGGVLWQHGDDNELEFSCHVGHSYTGDTLVITKSRMLEQAVVEAMRGLKEKGLLLRQLAARLNPHSLTTAQLIEQADQHDEHARLLQTHLLEGDKRVPAPIDTTADLMAQVVREMRGRADD